MPLSAAAQSEIRDALAGAGHGEKAGLVAELAARFGVSASTVYRAARVGGTKRRRDPARPEYREWTRVAVQVAHRAPKPMPLDLALEAAVKGGLLPPEAASMPIRTAMRIRREEGWAERRRRSERMFAEWPMQAVQFDGSTSEFLVVDGEAPGGDDWTLRLHRAPWSAGGYKNKPLGAERLRVTAYGIWDMATGYRRSVYAVARGESSIDSAWALCRMLEETGDPRRPLHGVPEDLWVDQGVLFRAAAGRDLVARLGIVLNPGQPYQKERMGGVERAWRAQWARFERALFARDSETILLSELNARLAEYEARENGSRPARFDVGGRTMTRADAWTALTRARPADRPLRRLPERAFETMAQEARRRVDVGGIVRWNGEYEVVGWHDRWVVARRSLDADAPDSLVLEDEETGERRVATPLARRAYGEIRGRERTALERLLDEDAPEVAADIWAPREGAPTDKVVPLPARTAPAAELENPLDASRHRDIGEAMTAFAAVYPHPLSADNRATVVARIEEERLDRRFVAELALSLLEGPAPSTASGGN